MVNYLSQSISPGLTVSEMTVVGKSEDELKFFENWPIIKGEDVADAVVYALSTPENVQVNKIFK